MNQAAQSKQNVHGHILFFFAVALGLYVAWLIRGMLALLYISALFAVVLSPIVRATSRIQIGRWKPFHGSMAILILLLGVAGAFAVFGFFALPPVINDLQSLAGELPARLPAILDKIKSVPYADRIDAGDLLAWIQRGLSGGATYLLASFKTWAGALLQVITGFVLTLYFILEGDEAYRWFLSFVPAATTASAGRDVEARRRPHGEVARGPTEPDADSWHAEHDCLSRCSACATPMCWA